MARIRRALSSILAIMGAVVLIGLLPSMAAAEETVAFTIKDSRILSAPGLARDGSGRLYWTANQSGERGAIYGVSSSGTTRGMFSYRTSPIDIEALAMVGDTLYVGDIGDRKQSRSFVTIYLFDNPRATGLTVTYRAYDFQFADGPRNAEALLVSESGRIFLVTKNSDRGTIYAAPRSPSRQGMNRLTRVADAPANVTDGVFLPGGDQLVLRTNTAVYLLDASTYQTITTTELPSKLRGNSVAVSLDGESLLLGSTGRNAKVYSIAVPTPPPTPTAAPSQSVEPEEEETGSVARGGRGTWFALGIAVAIAIVAGVVVGVIRDQ